MIVKCEECRKQIDRRPSHVIPKNYCSTTCYLLNTTKLNTPEKKKARRKEINAANKQRKLTDPAYASHLKELDRNSYLRRIKDPAYVEARRIRNRERMRKHKKSPAS